MVLLRVLIDVGQHWIISHERSQAFGRTLGEIEATDLQEHHGDRHPQHHKAQGGPICSARAEVGRRKALDVSYRFIVGTLHFKWLAWLPRMHDCFRFRMVCNSRRGRHAACVKKLMLPFEGLRDRLRLLVSDSFAG